MPLPMAPVSPDLTEPDEPDPTKGQDEASLWERLSIERDATARWQLVELYRPFARMVAATYFGRRIDDDIEFDDYHQWAIVGMIESIDRFDAKRGVQFKTFASRRMHGCILDGIESTTEKQRQIAVRRRLREERAADALAAARATEDAFDGDSLADTLDIFKVLAEVGIGLALGLMLEDTGMVAPAPDAVSPDQSYARVELRQLQASVRACVGRLSGQEQRVIQGHYLEDQRFTEIAIDMGLTRGRVSQIHKQALEKLRSALGPTTRLDIAL